MRDAQPQAIYLKDYRVPEFLIDQTDLSFDLQEEVTTVTARLAVRRNPDSDARGGSLVLHGQELVLKSLVMDGEVLEVGRYSVSDELLTINAVPDKFELQVVTEIYPQNNTSLEGLYKSSGMYCTQCEAEGFRKITYYLDRPDVMSIFTTTLEADKNRYPVLLSNGNNVASGEAPGNRHWVRWEDPFRKPSYLFALVAGDLQFVEDSFTTMSDKQVNLRIYVEQKDIGKCDHAMQSLKRAMQWDEEVYGREYDLDIFNIVAVDDFNMGAMENKSLNIFNTSCVLADPDTTTDFGFQRVEAVVAHEYFHNWSGNRVTCRDWFQLSLKEGFTVFRDAEFSADMGSRTVKRVEDVSLLRTVQFSEDSGPMAHPVRPDSFIEISNFYTVTIYEKGAEVVRMIANLLGPEAFRKGTDLYFDRFDGQAVTCEDFVRAMEDASGKDLTRFRRWYDQAGTPMLTARGSYDEAAQTYSLTVAQSCQPTPGQAIKQPFHIPLAMALLGRDGPLPLELAQPAAGALGDGGECVLDIVSPEQTFVFSGVTEKPIPSLLRGFSAPVRLEFDYDRDDLMFLMSNDSDGFCRWDASQQLGVRVIQDLVAAIQDGSPAQVDERLTEAFRQILCDSSLDKSMVALMLNLPSEAYLAEISGEADVQAIHQARTDTRLAIARTLNTELWRVYRENQCDEVYSPSSSQIAMRSLKNAALSYLMLTADAQALQACVEQFDSAHNMTDVLAAFNCLLNSEFEEQAKTACEAFYQRWQSESLVINQWFMAQASAMRPGALERVKTLMQHPAFDIRNPNKVRALIGAFCGQNPINFHEPDGSGYRFLADRVIELNALNPQIASRLMGPLTKWKKYKSESAVLMRQELQRIKRQPQLSRDVYEVVSKCLQD